MSCWLARGGRRHQRDMRLRHQLATRHHRPAPSWEWAATRTRKRERSDGRPWTTDGGWVLGTAGRLAVRLTWTRLVAGRTGGGGSRTYSDVPKRVRPSAIEAREKTAEARERRSQPVGLTRCARRSSNPVRSPRARARVSTLAVRGCRVSADFRSHPLSSGRPSVRTLVRCADGPCCGSIRTAEGADGRSCVASQPEKNVPSQGRPTPVDHRSARHDRPAAREERTRGTGTGEMEATAHLAFN